MRNNWIQLFSSAPSRYRHLPLGYRNKKGGCLEFGRCCLALAFLIVTVVVLALQRPGIAADGPDLERYCSDPTISSIAAAVTQPSSPETVSVFELIKENDAAGKPVCYQRMQELNMQELKLSPAAASSARCAASCGGNCAPRYRACPTGNPRWPIYCAADPSC